MYSTQHELHLTQLYELHENTNQPVASKLYIKPSSSLWRGIVDTKRKAWLLYNSQKNDYYFQYNEEQHPCRYPTRPRFAKALFFCGEIDRYSVRLGRGLCLLDPSTVCVLSRHTHIYRLNIYIYIYIGDVCHLP